MSARCSECGRKRGVHHAAYTKCPSNQRRAAERAANRTAATNTPGTDNAVATTPDVHDRVQRAGNTLTADSRLLAMGLMRDGGSFFSKSAAEGDIPRLLVSAEVMRDYVNSTPDGSGVWHRAESRAAVWMSKVAEHPSGGTARDTMLVVFNQIDQHPELNEAGKAVHKAACVTVTGQVLENAHARRLTPTSDLL